MRALYVFPAKGGATHITCEGPEGVPVLPEDPVARKVNEIKRYKTVERASRCSVRCFSHLLLLVFPASQLQLKRMFKKDALKKAEHLEVQGKELELTRPPLVCVCVCRRGLERIPAASGGSQHTCDHAIFYCATIPVNFNAWKRSCVVQR